MPAPQASTMQKYASQHFRDLGITLPMSWKNPLTKVEKDQFKNAFAEADREGHNPKPMSLFRAATTTKLHAEAADTMSEKIGKYMDGICAAICSAWSTWQSACSASGITVSGPIASAGTFQGPALKPLILASAPQATDAELRYSKAIANAMDSAWSSWVSSLKVPGMTWYPLFSAFSAPMAPPTANTPVALGALAQNSAPLMVAQLKKAMIDELGDSDALHHAAIFESVASAVEQCFTTWTSSTQVTNVMGTGPVPSFAPPVTPAGPVVGGTATMAPGGLV